MKQKIIWKNKELRKNFLSKITVKEMYPIIITQIVVWAIMNKTKFNNDFMERLFDFMERLLVNSKISKIYYIDLEENSAGIMDQFLGELLEGVVK